MIVDRQTDRHADIYYTHIHTDMLIIIVYSPKYIIEYAFKQQPQYGFEAKIIQTGCKLIQARYRYKWHFAL